MSIALKSALMAAGSAFVVNNASVLLLMATGIAYQWILVWPLIHTFIGIEPTLLGLVLAYLAGFFQFFILFWIIIGLILRRNAAS
jgi:hypothetical protein